MMNESSEVLLLSVEQEERIARIATDALEDKEHVSVGQAARITLKCEDAFLVTDISGDFLATKREMGLFWHGTRFLRSCNLLLDGQPLMVLSYQVSDSGDACQVDLTNIAFTTFGTDTQQTVEQGAIHVHRQLQLLPDRLLQTITITSFHADPMPLTLSLKVGADFCDMFEVRGAVRAQRGVLLAPDMNTDTVTLGYRGRDSIVRESHFTLSPPADHVVTDRLFWHMQLSKSHPVELHISMQVREGLPGEEISRRDQIARVRAEVMLSSLDTTTSSEPIKPVSIHTSDPLFNRLLERGMNDLTMLSTVTPHGRYPYAGIPWFSCPFGRDALITCIEFLPWMPDIVRGTLTFLAAHQGTKCEPFTDEEPGKMLHEFRTGEMANQREIPYIPYYGSIDVTPLFLIVLADYIRWTDDLTFLTRLWPHAQAAARWLVNYGDRDGDGFIEYHKASEQGLHNQGWKDAWDSISYGNGAMPVGPIALCEVQGYTYAAYRAMSYLAGRLRKQYKADYWTQKAEIVRKNFLRAFWWEEQQSFYLALDGNKQPCDVVTSNAGQCLWSGIVPEDKAQMVIKRLMQRDMYSGWGIRTLSTQATRYNPLSYHNGSIWPHDNAMVGTGFAHYGGKWATSQLLKSMYEASLYFEGMRLPELYCGFTQRMGYGPTRYPVACSPQAWAAGAPFLLLGALLGLRPDAQHKRLTVAYPQLPDWLTQIEIQGVYVGNQQAHLRFVHTAEKTIVMIEPDNEVEIQVIPCRTLERS